MIDFQALLEEVIFEKVMRVRHHLTSKQKTKSKLFRIKNKSKLKKARLKKKKLLKSKPKPKPGYRYGVDGKLHKIVRVKGRRKTR